MKTYHTTDFNLAAVLKTVGEQPEETERDGGRMSWIFKETPLAKKTIKGYADGSLCLPVQQLFFNMKLLKSLIHSKL
jgi:hypothetical protein